MNYYQPNFCPSCGRCLSCGSGLTIPSYTVTGLGLSNPPPSGVGSEVHMDPFDQPPTDDGHGDDGRLLAGP
jgi:hypothetical protein